MRNPAVQADVALAILDELQAIRRLLEGRAAPAAARPAHARLLAAIVDTMNGLDLPFEASEVLEAAGKDAALAAALEALGISTVGDLGVILRSLRDRELDGRRLVRDGRQWVICT